MSNHLKKIALFFLLLITLFSYFNSVFKSNDEFVNVYDDFKNQKKVDILFLGSSHSYCSYNPKIIDSVIGAKSFNFGTASLSVYGFNALFTEALKYQKPNILIIDVFQEIMVKPEDKKEKGFHLKFLDHLSNLSIEKHKTINSIFSLKEYPGVYATIFRNHENWFKIKYLKLDRKASPSTYFNLYKGHRSFLLKTDTTKLLEYNNFKTFKPKRVLKDTTIISKKVKEELVSVIKRAKNNNIQVLLIVAPDLRVQFRDFKFFDELDNIALENKIQFLNLNEYYEELNLNLNDFLDIQHLNGKGANKSSLFLSDYLLNTYYNN